MAESKGIVPLEITPQNIGRFRKMEAIVLRTTEGGLALPLLPPEQILDQPARNPLVSGRAFWTSVGWFHPAYITNRAVGLLRQALVRVAPDNREEALSSELSTIYSPEHIASMLLDRYPQLPDIANYVPLIREAAEVFYGHHHRAAVACLVPVVEGVLSQMLTRFHGPADETGADLLRRVIDAECNRATERMLYRDLWVPREYKTRTFLEQFDEYIYMLATFEDFGTRHLFERTSKFRSTQQLNRHGILHGQFTDFGKPGNFYRLWSILDLLAFAMTFSTNNVSVLAPNISQRAAKLAFWLKLKSAATAK